MHDLIGTSAAIEALRKGVAAAARSDAKVLITGESGSGKEVTAQSLHRQSARAGRPMLAINCAGIPETLLESALFGHARGSFTGAVRDHRGLFESAHGGTVFLDEIAEMPARMQGALLRVLESGEIQPIGDHRSAVHVDVRVVAATNGDLRDRIERGAFRQDLFYRLNVIHVQVPPLRERLDDVPALVECFCERFCGQDSARPPALTREARAVLTSYHWPGNVRELRNLVERLVVTSAGESVDTRRLAALIAGDRPALGRPVCEGPRGPDPEHATSAAETLFNRIVLSGESFWSVAHDPFMARDLTRQQLTELVQRGLSSTDGSYRELAGLFRVSNRDLRRFTGFLKRYGCGTAPRELRETA